MKPKASLRPFLALAGSSLLLASHVHAQGPYYWDNNGSDPGFGTASGTWSAGSTLFSNSATGVVTPPGNTIPTNSDDVYFGANTPGNALGSGSITVDGSVVVKGLYYEGVSTGTLTFNAINGGKIFGGNSRVESTETGSILTFNANFEGATTQFRGSGSTTVFNGIYKNTGHTTVITGHTLHFGSTATLDIANGRGIGFSDGNTNATIRYSSNNDGGYNGAVNGNSTTNKIIKDGSATSTLTLAGGNAFAGQYRIEAGTLKFDLRTGLYSGTDTSWLASNIIVGNTGVLGLRVGGTNRFTITDVETLLSNLGAGNGTSTTGFAAGSAIAIDTTNAAGDQTLSALVENSTGLGGGSFGLTKLGANTLILDNINTYTGATKVNGGTLRAGASSGGQAFGVGSAVTMANVAGATLDLNGTNQTIGSLAGGGGTGGNVTLGANATLTTGGNDSSTIYSGVISGTGTSGLTKTGDGTFTLAGASTYFGNTTVNDGVLDVSGVGARIYSGIVTPTGVVTVNTGGTLVVGGFAKGGSNSLGDLDTPAANLVLNGGTLRINDTNTVGRAVTIGANGGTIEVNTSGYVMNYNAVLPNAYTDNSTLTLTGSGSATMGKAITGSGVSLVKNGSGTWTLNPGATSTYTGTTTISNGSLSAGNIVVSGGGSNLGNATTAVTLGAASTQGTLSYTGNSATYTRGFTIGGAGGGRLDVTASGQTLQVDTGNVTGTGLFTVGGAGNTTINANLTHTGGLTKADTGTLTLSSNNTTYTGAVTVTGGTLELAHNNAAGTSAGGIAISGDLAATLQINAGITTADDITFSNTNASSSVLRGIASGTAYNVGTNGTLSSDLVPGGKPNTTAKILTAANNSNSNASSATILNMSFSGTAPSAVNDGARRSDVFKISGTGSDSFVLQLFAGDLGADSRLGWLDGTSWTNVGTGLNLGAWDINATYSTNNWGYDSSTGSVWAVVSQGGSYSLIPEPTSALAGLLLTAGLLRRRRK